MRDRQIFFTDGRRVNVADLTDDEITVTLDMLSELNNVGGTDATRESVRERLEIERLIRSLPAED